MGQDVKKLKFGTKLGEWITIQCGPHTMRFRVADTERGQFGMQFDAPQVFSILRDRARKTIPLRARMAGLKIAR